MEQPDKFPDLFNVTLMVEFLDRTAKPSKEPPWATFETQRITPKYCFSNKEEQDSVASQFGQLSPPWNFAKIARQIWARTV